MDTERFDALTRALGETRTRRQALKFLAGTAVGGILNLFRIESSFANVESKPSEQGTSIQELIVATPIEIQQFLNQAKQNGDFIALRSYFSSFGFNSSGFEGARGVTNGPSEMKMLVELLANTQQPSTTIQLTYVQLPTGEKFAYSITLDNEQPLVGHYRNQTGEITQEYPRDINSTNAYSVWLPIILNSNNVNGVIGPESSSSTPSHITPLIEDDTIEILGFSPMSIIKHSIVQQEMNCADCPGECDKLNKIQELKKTACNLIPVGVCVSLGAFSGPLVAAGVGVICGLIGADICAKLHPPISCGEFCKTACNNCTFSEPQFTCLVGEARVICDGELCARQVTNCKTQTNGSEVCAPPQGACPTGQFFMGYYRTGFSPPNQVIAPYCCAFDGINCGALPNGRWGSCCPSNTICKASNGGYICCFPGPHCDLFP